jgi:hypothetical protein
MKNNFPAKAFDSDRMMSPADGNRVIIAINAFYPPSKQGLVSNRAIKASFTFSNLAMHYK